MSIEKNIESMLSELRTISSMIYTVYQVAREVPTGTAPASAAPASTASAEGAPASAAPASTASAEGAPASAEAAPASAEAAPASAEAAPASAEAAPASAEAAPASAEAAPASAEAAPASAEAASTASADPDALMVQARAICQGLVRSNQGDKIKKTLGTFKASKVTDLGPTDLELFIRELSK